MNRREMLTTTALGMGGFIVGTGFAEPACGVSKEKAVRVAGFAIEISKEAVPLLDLLGAHDLAITVDAKVIPAMEKLKDALAAADIPSSQSMLQNVRNVLSGIATGLLSLPDSPRRTTIMGIVATVKVLLMTVEAFVESETTLPARAASPTATGGRPNTNAESIRKVFEAVRLP